ncbi:AmmeMemoRadiSam system radical SAM enzyme [Eubacterium sp. 1001713B170207_170306_E7]|uniref:AmmeMemoRadiSam system radical SAM enzyme n=1 Tax=Eubacterium sp. 1001713B170207_170306_E7 TaxID=2787097 RepID=UPI001898F03F|nr:AmmeMemoRadiSam system radical SAM enzyme [Eubacterium sp. 1001713B170207_170306_E7]
MKRTCDLCPHHCVIEEGRTGFCQARGNNGERIVCENYGRLTSAALDPIEKKPLNRFCPGSTILSVGSYGCNLRCSFCQNSSISMGGRDTRTIRVTPEMLADKAESLKEAGNIGIAYTYNEPLVGYEFVRDCAALIHERGMKNVVVTNGNICTNYFEGLFPLIDAMNIDLKAFNEAFYEMVSGDLETVKANIRLAAERCHVEITTLIIPGENDSEEEMDALSGWLAAINPKIPLHISRFFPSYQMVDRGPTAAGTVYQLAEIARNHLEYVYTGNC